MLWFLNIMLNVGHNMAHTVSHFLLEVLRGIRIILNSKCEFFKNEKAQKSYAILIKRCVHV